MAGLTQGHEHTEAALAPPVQHVAAKTGGTARLQALVKRVLASGAAGGTTAQPASCHCTEQHTGPAQAALQQTEGSETFLAAPVPTPPAAAEPTGNATAGAAAASGSPSTAMPAAAVVIKTEDCPGAACGPSQPAAARPIDSLQAQPVDSSPRSGRGRWPLGVSQRPCGACLVRIVASLDGQGRLSGKPLLPPAAERALSCWPALRWRAQQPCPCLLRCAIWLPLTWAC